MPYVALVKNKTVCRTDDIEVLGVYEDITEWDITQFARTHSSLKIATTYDSLPRVVSALQSIGIDPYKRAVPAGGRVARAVQLLFVPT